MHPLLSRLVPLTILAAGGLAAAGWTAYRTVRPRPVPPLAIMPPQSRYAERVSASGLVEGDGNTTSIGVPEPGLIAEMAVHVGQPVTSGELLFRLDDRMARAELAVAAADAAIAEASAQAAAAELARLQALPRAEDAIPATAQVAVAEAQLSLARTRRIRLERLGERGIESELEDARLAETVAEAQVGSAKAALGHAALPAWAQDLAVARRRIDIADNQLLAAKARVASATIRLGRLEIRAPRSATVVSANASVGALAAPGDPDLVVLDDLDHLLVRVEVDESQVWKLRPGAAGQGWLRGDRSRPIELRYERTEPRAAPRRAIPGKPGERLDGRAVQVLYRMEDPPGYIRPGLLLEVDIDATGSAKADAVIR